MLYAYLSSADGNTNLFGNLLGFDQPGRLVVDVGVAQAEVPCLESKVQVFRLFRPT